MLTPPAAPPQNQVPAPGPGPAAPVVPAPGEPVVSIPGVPQTVQELMTLRLRARELEGQLSSTRNRRDQLAQRIVRGDPDVQGLQQQVTYLDGRILKLEQQIDQNSQAIANAAPAAVFQMPGRVNFQNFPRSRMDPTPIFIVFILFVLAPVAVGFVWRSIRRQSNTSLPPGWTDHLQRMERLEQAVDTVAIEIERISEGQRFLTKALADRMPLQNGGVPQRPPEPVAVPAQKEGAPKALGGGVMEPLQVENREVVAEKR